MSSSRTFNLVIDIADDFGERENLIARPGNFDESIHRNRLRAEIVLDDDSVFIEFGYGLIGIS